MLAGRGSIKTTLYSMNPSENILDRKTCPPVLDPVDLDLTLKPAHRFRLDNGAEVYAIEGGAQEVTMLEMVFGAGNWQEERPLVSAATNFLLKNGTKARSAFSINEKVDYYGAFLNRNSHCETASLSLHSLSKHLGHLFPLMSELLTESIFPEPELAIYKQNQKQKLTVNLKKSDFVANRAIDEMLYGKDHPYGKCASLEDYDTLQRDDLAAFYDRYYTKGHCVLFIAGHLPKGYEAMLNSSFGQLPFVGDPFIGNTYSVSPTSERKKEISVDANGVQASLRLARPFPNRHHPDYTKAQVLNNVFGGFFGSRLMSNIREDKGYTYGIHSYLQNHTQQSAWMVSTEAGKEFAQATLEEVYKEMEILKNEPIEEEELFLVKNYMIGSILADIDGPFQVASRWKTYVLNGLDESYFTNAIGTIKEVSAKELMELAQRYLNKEDFLELSVV